ncbi:hypothetical protein [Streptomyces wedmorensis]
MDDDKTITPTTYRLTIAGQEYEFGEPEPELLERMIMVFHMNAGPLLTVEAITKWLADAAGPTVWQAITRRFIAGEVTANDMLKAMEDLVVAVKQDSTADAA